MSSLIVKVLTWRAISVVITAWIVWIHLGSVSSATSLSVFLHAILTIANYFFEIVWEKFESGRGIE